MRRVLLAAVLGALASAPGASAGVRIKSVDTTAYPHVAVTVVTARSPSRPVLREDGRRPAALQVENLSDGKSVVLAIDRSHSMQGASLANAIAAARAFVAAKPPSDRIAIVAFGARAIQLTRFSSATIDADTALRGLEVDRRQGTALNDAVVTGARALADEPAPGRVIILLTDGRDVSSAASRAQAVRAARKAGASVFPVAIEGPQFSPAALHAIAAATGGTYRGTSSSATLARLYRGVAAELSRMWRLEYLSAAASGTRSVRVTVPGEGSAAATYPGLRRPAPDASLLPAAVYTTTTGSILLALAVGALVLLALAFLQAARRGSWLRNRLSPHVKAYTQERTKKEEGERLAMASELFRVTEKSLGHLRLWAAIGRRIERADLPLRTVELVYVCAGAGLATMLLLALFGVPALVLLPLVGFAALVPYLVVALKARRRLGRFEEQLPDLLLTMAASLKAGHSFKQGLQSVVDEGRPPASDEFRRVLTEMQLGRPMDDALAEAAERLGSKNFEFVITAVTIQRQVGGSLAALFDMVADTVRQRQQFARKVKGLTAMGRGSAYVLIAMPFVMALALTVLNHSYMAPLFNTSAGHYMIGFVLVNMALGSLMLKKIVSFKV